MVQQNQGFWNVVNSISRLENVSAVQKCLLYVLCHHCGSKLECWPSVSRLAEATGLKPRAVQTNLRILADAKLISIKMNAGKNGTNVYRLTGACGAPLQEKHPACEDEPGASDNTLPGDSGAPKHPRTQKEPSKETSSIKRRESPSDAWNRVCKGVKQFDYLYDSAGLRKFLGDDVMNAARDVGIPKIIAKDKYTERRLREAFESAYTAVSR